MSVYFAKSGNEVKIGYSQDPYQRMTGLKSHYKRNVKLLAYIPGTRREESDLHRRFRSLHVKDEWFVLAGELLEYVEGLPKAPLSRPKDIPAPLSVTIRVPLPLLNRLMKATNKNRNPYAPSITQVLLRGTELALKEVEAK